jgi:hypothetical protein
LHSPSDKSVKTTAPYFPRPGNRGGSIEDVLPFSWIAGHPWGGGGGVDFPQEGKFFSVPIFYWLLLKGGGDEADSRKRPWFLDQSLAENIYLLISG